MRQQNRKKFGLAYKTILGNDTESNDHGYKLHLTWGCLASPSEKQNSSVNESPEPLAMSWEYSATPVKVTAAVKGKKLKATATMTFDSTKLMLPNSRSWKVFFMEQIVLDLQSQDFQCLMKSFL